jgi:hypothetical protein
MLRLALFVGVVSPAVYLSLEFLVGTRVQTEQSPMEVPAPEPKSGNQMIATQGRSSFEPLVP